MNGSYVAPRLLSADQRNGCSRNAVARGQYGPKLAALPNRCHIARCEPRRATVLLSHVAHVVAGCAEEQMSGVAARRVVAAVAHERGIGNGSVLPLPREPVSRRSSEGAVAEVDPSTVPDPAFVTSGWDRDEGPEPELLGPVVSPSGVGKFLQRSAPPHLIGVSTTETVALMRVVAARESASLLAVGLQRCERGAAPLLRVVALAKSFRLGRSVTGGELARRLHSTTILGGTVRRHG